ncbi:hypothetical protein RvY_18126 [Ramazzottius varieornatus]|uniref:Uncharacterized protein n=1 Tax=Ramazzottius varieornatus TaxID=947166 RepID=A0A1D1WAP0_RAMVA|nr:hypothetical protein RvY_18126 [Ramazzottius varieornatus]
MMCSTWTSLRTIVTRWSAARSSLLFCLLCLIFSRTLAQPSNSRTQWPSRNHPTSHPHMGAETLVSILQERGDPAAESNAHRLTLSLQTASRFITDVLERSIADTLGSTVTAREHLFYSLQSVKNDSAGMVELVESSSATVAEAAKKAKQEMNEAIRTSLHHLAESIKIILRALPPSPLNEQRLLTIIDGAQYRMEIVVENAGQRIRQALHSYRGHLLKVDKDSGQLMVDGPSTQQATDVLKHVIQASQTQIEGAVLAGTSFVLARLRSYLAGEPLADTSSSTLSPHPLTTSLATFPPSTTTAATTSQLPSTMGLHDHVMEDPQHEEVSSTLTSLSSGATEAPMVINTSSSSGAQLGSADGATTGPTSTRLPIAPNSTLEGIHIDQAEQATVAVFDTASRWPAFNENTSTTASTMDSSALGPAFSWQDDLLMSFPTRNDSATSTPSMADDDMAGWPVVRQATTKRFLPFTKDSKTSSSAARTRRSTGLSRPAASLPSEGDKVVKRNTRPASRRDTTSPSTTQTLIRRRIPYHLRPI